MMDGRGKSDSPIVSGKPPNRTEEPIAEIAAGGTRSPQTIPPRVVRVEDRGVEAAGNDLRQQRRGVWGNPVASHNGCSHSGRTPGRPLSGPLLLGPDVEAGWGGLEILEQGRAEPALQAVLRALVPVPSELLPLPDALQVGTREG